MNFGPKPTAKTRGVVKLPFVSRQIWPASWPAFVWRGVVIAGQEREITEYYDLPNTHSFEDVLSQAYPNLTWFEVVDLTMAVEAVGLPHSPEKLWEKYGHRLHPDIQDYQRLYAALPAEFRRWLIEKDFGPRDLAPLKALPQVAAYRDFLVKWPGFQFSKSDGQQALEWWVDLTLAKHPDVQTLWQSTDSGAQFLERLEQLRYPLASKQKQNATELLKKLPWPRRLQARVARLGDLSGFEVKFFAHNCEEFSKQIEGLQTVARKLSDENEFR